MIVSAGTVDFKVEGFEELGKFGDIFKKNVQNAVDLASKNGVNKAIDLIAYGKVNNIRANSLSAKSVVGWASNKLRIPSEHLYYRTFVQGVKVSAGKGRGAKPYASAMIRGNSINVADLLAKGAEAKSMYGYTSRKRKVGTRKRPNLKGTVGNARVGGKRGGKVKIGRLTYTNAYIEDGSTRASSHAMNAHYINKLGANKDRPALKGKQFMVFKKKNKGQKLPYPSKAMKIPSMTVLKVLNAATEYAVSSNWNTVIDMQVLEVQKRLKKYFK